MRIGIAGAGAVGSYFGAILHFAGHDVTFLARGKHFQAMKQAGLRMIKGEEEFLVDATFTDKINELSECELVLFCVKSNDTEAMASQLKLVLPSNCLIVTMQNGVENEQLLGTIFDHDRILSTAAYIQAAIDEPGKVTQKGRVKLVIGELHSSAKASCLEINQLFQAAGIDSVYAQSIMENKWRKLIWNVTFNPLSAILNANVGEILANEELRYTASLICQEAIDVAERLKIELKNNRTVESVLRKAERAKKHHTSMLQDRRKGKPMEVEAMCGYIVRKGLEINVPTPNIQVVYSILTYMDKSKH
ncbi:ketopantoate reductase family protein [Virgibacillus salexigens]|uniref:ketopantoate reductase family protein n=1 Tax=Virgibacillus salexigens TaxID=61016 RepID=UPI00190BEC28|nr:2-dehydropantoate 2-reductase [Virgibacillus salexigens]